MVDIIKRWMELEGPATVSLVTDTIQEIERLRAFAQFIVDGYPRGDLNHEDFRVQAYMAACDVLGITPPVLDILDKSVSNSDAETV